MRTDVKAMLPSHYCDIRVYLTGLKRYGGAWQEGSEVDFTACTQGMLRTTHKNSIM